MALTHQATAAAVQGTMVGAVCTSNKFSLSTLTTSQVVKSFTSETRIIPILQVRKLRHAQHAGNHMIGLDQSQIASQACSLDFLQHSYSPALN